MGGVTDATEPAEQAENAEGRVETTDPPAAGAPRPRRRLRMLLTVAAVVLALDVLTKVLAVRFLTPGQPVSIIGDTVTWTLVRNPGPRSRWPPATPGG